MTLNLVGHTTLVVRALRSDTLHKQEWFQTLDRDNSLECLSCGLH